MPKLTAADFSYELPERLIARYPTESRGESRLLALNRGDGALAHKRFAEISDYLKPNDLLVLNNTRTISARLYARKRSGGRVEVLVSGTVQAEGGAERLHAHIKANRALTPDTELIVLDRSGEPTSHILRVLGRVPEYSFLYELQPCEGTEAAPLLDECGELPLPPYLKRREEPLDRSRYHTVFATERGALATPTAGLHFTDELLQSLTAAGVRIVYITLHVGYATFSPIRTDYIEDHEMHSEYLVVDEQACAAIEQSKAAGAKVVAVGTTVVRALETAAAHSKKGSIAPYQGDTQLFIYPGHQFKVIDAMVTNFHQPGTTLLPLVAAFAGQAHIMNAYREAVRENYRFLSYGDAMLVYTSA